MAVMISMGFLVAWTPYVAVSFWSMFNARDHLNPLVTLLPCLFAKSSTAYNPFIYFIFQQTSRHKQFGLWKTVPCCSKTSDRGSKRESKMATDCNVTDETMMGLMGVQHGKEIVTVAK